MSVLAFFGVIFLLMIGLPFVYGFVTGASGAIAKIKEEQQKNT